MIYHFTFLVLFLPIWEIFKILNLGKSLVNWNYVDLDRRENKTMQQEEIVKLNDTSSMTTYRVKNPQTVYDVLKKLNLESKNFAVLVNGIKAKHSQVVDTEDQILVLPKIAGG